MANALTRNVREYMIEDDKLDIPYDGVGFVKWLTEVRHFSRDEAEAQVKAIRDMDIDLWEPGDPEIFQMISSWMADARNAKSESVRNLMYDFIFITLETDVDYFREMKKDVTKESLPFIDSVIEAYKLYIAYFKDILDYYPENMEEIMAIDEEEEEPSKQKYPSVPLEEEYKKYLDECKYSPGNRDKMLSNLRKLNALIINNRRGDSDWLQAIADKAQSGVNIRYARLTAHHLVHSVMENSDKRDAKNWALKGGLTALNRYLDFLICTYKTKQD